MDPFVEYPVGAGIKAAMLAEGDVPVGQEVYPANAQGVESGVAVAFGKKAEYVYDKETATVRVNRYNIAYQNGQVVPF